MKRSRGPLNVLDAAREGIHIYESMISLHRSAAKQFATMVLDVEHLANSIVVLAYAFCAILAGQEWSLEILFGHREWRFQTQLQGV